MANEQAVIPAKFRTALLAKSILLASMAAFFLWLGAEAWARWQGLLPRVGVAALTVLLALYLGWAASLAMMDVVFGQAIVSAGAAPLEKRWTGYSLRLPTGRHVEYILYNPWQPIEHGTTYTVRYGRHSGVLVAPPEPEESD